MSGQRRRRWTIIAPTLGLSTIFGGNVFCLFSLLTTNLFNLNFPHLKLRLADAIYNFKWVQILQIWRNEGRDLLILLIDFTCYAYITL